MVDKFYEFYSKIIEDTNYENSVDKILKRPSIIAHSFGSYIIGYCMLKYPDVKFDKIILCGSILPKNFNWNTIFLNDQVNHLKNEYGIKDFWTKNVGRFVKRTGGSGNDGFSLNSRQLEQNKFEYFTHSDYFKGQHIKFYWLPFLQLSSRNLSIVHGHDIEDRKEFNDMLEVSGTVIDKICYGNLEHYNEVEIERGLSDDWIMINPDIYTFLFDRSTDTIIGYINAMPVTDEIFERIKLGQLQDNEITAEHIVPFLKNQNLKIYLMSIAIHPNARKINEGLIHMAFEKLLNGFINKLIEYYKNSNIKVLEFIAIGWTTEGKRLCKMLGMNEIGKDKYTNPIFSINFENENILENIYFDSIKSLIKTYKSSK